ncbi:LysE family transporter [Klebsiella pneumoniae]|uniref:LysE family transporter n=1 Tax=Klebsiella pneumoniae TaxID=573 RepID=UPI0010342DC1
MHTLSTLFPAVFPALALSHFVALLSPGPDFFLLIGYAVRYRIRGSIGLCLGIAAGNALYIVLAIVGWGLLRQAPLLFLLIELLGAGYLLWIGSLLIRSRPATLAMESVRAARPGFGRQLLLGLGSSLLNPKNALFYLALMTSLLGPAVTLLQRLCLGIAAGNALYIVLAIVGWGLLRQAPLLFLLIELLGAGYLLWIGSLLIRSRPATLAMESVRAARPGFGRQLLLGLGSSLLNPKNALFYLALMTSLLGPAVTLLQQTVSGLWMVSVVFFWDLLLVSAIALPQIQRRLGAIVWRVERAAGAILMLFGLGIIWRFLHDLAVRLYA